jgi:hypothetical protein
MNAEMVEVITERLGLDGDVKPITKVVFHPANTATLAPHVVVEVAGHDALKLSVRDARILGDALCVATGRGFLASFKPKAAARRRLNIS